MPSPAKTTDSQIIAAARKLVARRGRDGFSMKDVAAAVGICRLRRLGRTHVDPIVESQVDVVDRRDALVQCRRKIQVRLEALGELLVAHADEIAVIHDRPPKCT